MRRPDPDGAGAIAFAVVRRHGIWRVTRDGLFFGDYRNKAEAIAAANAAANLPAARGAAASVTVIERGAQERGAQGSTQARR